MTSTEGMNKKALDLVNWLADSAIAGVPPLTSAYALAAEYEKDPGYADAEARVDALINWETAKNFGTGFLTGVGGVLTLPLTLPTALAASWVIQARLVGAIALLYGHDLKTPQARTLLALALVGGGVKEVLKHAGVGLATNLMRGAATSTLTAINRAAGKALISRAASNGALNLTKAIPLVGGVISGGFDGYTCRVVGLAAKDLFRPVDLDGQEPPSPAEEPVAAGADPQVVPIVPGEAPATP